MAIESHCTNFSTNHNTIQSRTIFPLVDIFVARGWESKSLYRSRARRHFYGTENEIWASFGPVGNTEKKIWADYEQLLRAFISWFRGQFFFLIFLKTL